MKKTLLIGAIAAALLSTGCGGNGSTIIPIAPLPGDNSSGNVRPGTIAPTSNLRSLASGDVWEYTVSGRITTGTSTKNVSGTMTRIVSNDTLAGAPVLKITERMTLQPQGGVPMNTVTETFVSQNGSGDIQTIGSREGTFIFETQSSGFDLPGTWQLGMTAAGDTTMATGAGSPQAESSISSTLTVTSSQDVITAVGAYGTWRAERSDQGRIDYTGVTDRIELGQVIEVGTVLSIDRTDSSTEWWAPAIGSFVRKTSTLYSTTEKIKDVTQVAPTVLFTKETINTTTTLTYSLKSTTVR